MLIFHVSEVRRQHQRISHVGFLQWVNCLQRSVVYPFQVWFCVNLASTRFLAELFLQQLPPILVCYISFNCLSYLFLFHWVAFFCHLDNSLLATKVSGSFNHNVLLLAVKLFTIYFIGRRVMVTQWWVSCENAVLSLFVGVKISLG